MFLDKIVHVVVDQFPEFPPIGTSDYLDTEFFQRNQIMKGLRRCHPNNRDIIIISDVDEIIRSNKIDQIVKLIDKKIMILFQNTFSPIRKVLS
jgi:beta-1,4-mannosyl-glycoprotein beta-1,4-N-acetylglucosaminyltransferase